MTDEQTLLAAIIARPDDDLPRLIYADWLDETDGIGPCMACTDKSGFCWGKVANCHTCHGAGEVSNGHAERAEFIRVQCELARHGGRGLSGTLTYEQWDALRRRERELPLKNWRKWVPYLTPGHSLEVILSPRWEFGGTPAGLFRRGFVELITCSWSDFRQHADAIRRATPLRDVMFTSPPPDYRACGACKDCCDRLPKFCERERERLGLPADITFHLPNIESVVSGFPSWGHQPGGWTAAQPLRSGGR
jgi:hypothetical protein